MVAGRWQVLVDGFAVGDEAVPELQATCHPAIGCQRQDQEGDQEGESHHKESDGAGVMQVGGAVLRLDVHKLQRERERGREGDHSVSRFSNAGIMSAPTS